MEFKNKRKYTFVKTDVQIIYMVNVYFEVGILRDVLGLKNKNVKSGFV